MGEEAKQSKDRAYMNSVLFLMMTFKGVLKTLYFCDPMYSFLAKFETCLAPSLMYMLCSTKTLLYPRPDRSQG